MRFKDVKELSGMSLAKFSRYFRVPYRTVQNWAAEVSQCPPYLLDLFVYKLQIENVIPYDAVSHSNITPAVRITAHLGGDSADAFAEIYRALQKKETLVRLSTHGHSDICVVCARDAKIAILRLLRKYGDIVAVDDINVVHTVGKQRYTELAVIDDSDATQD